MPKSPGRSTATTPNDQQRYTKEPILSTKLQELPKGKSSASVSKENCSEPGQLLQMTKSSRDNQNSSKGKQKPVIKGQRSTGARASDLTNHVIGAVLNLLAALLSAVNVTALQLVSVNITL